MIPKIEILQSKLRYVTNRNPVSNKFMHNNSVAIRNGLIFYSLGLWPFWLWETRQDGGSQSCVEGKRSKKMGARGEMRFRPQHPGGSAACAGGPRGAGVQVPPLECLTSPDLLANSESWKRKNLQGKKVSQRFTKFAKFEIFHFFPPLAELIWHIVLSDTLVHIDWFFFAEKGLAVRSHSSDIIVLCSIEVPSTTTKLRENLLSKKAEYRIIDRSYNRSTWGANCIVHLWRKYFSPSTWSSLLVSHGRSRRGNWELCGVHFHLLCCVWAHKRNRNLNGGDNGEQTPAWMVWHVSGEYRIVCKIYLIWYRFGFDFGVSVRWWTLRQRLGWRVDKKGGLGRLVSSFLTCVPHEDSQPTPPSQTH